MTPKQTPTPQDQVVKSLSHFSCERVGSYLSLTRISLVLLQFPHG